MENDLTINIQINRSSLNLVRKMCTEINYVNNGNTDFLRANLYSSAKKIRLIDFEQRNNGEILIKFVFPEKFRSKMAYLKMKIEKKIKNLNGGKSVENIETELGLNNVTMTKLYIRNGEDLIIKSLKKKISILHKIYTFVNLKNDFNKKPFIFTGCTEESDIEQICFINLFSSAKI
ncbi:hypothetical protein MHBO_000159 [Bonamia ostreae]|uniref:Uncharacterized protein n=1 Tax=Bonamia ostreae TaxID=126728 RepID=A0ABV2AFB0_9EUKA